MRVEEWHSADAARPRAACAQPPSKMAVPALTLAEAWLLAIRDGRLSVADCAAWADLRCQEGGAEAMMEALARCAQERTLEAWASKQPWIKVLPVPYAFRAPSADGRGGARMETLHCLPAARRAPRDRSGGAPRL